MWCAQFSSLSFSHHFATYEFSDRKSFDVEVKKFASYAAKNKENIPRHRCAHIVPFLMFFSLIVFAEESTNEYLNQNWKPVSEVRTCAVFI
jgi:hypothetical protein